MRTHSLRSLNIFEGVIWYPSSGSLMPGRIAQSVGHLTRKSEVLSSIPGLVWSHTFISSSAQEGQLPVTGESMCTKYWLTT